MQQLDPHTYLNVVSTRAERTRQPDRATIELTYGCNLRCVHCYNPTHRALPQELTTAEVCSILTQMADLGVLTVSLSGGEPSLRPDIDIILRHARRAGLLVSLLSNATRMTPAFASLLDEIGVSRLSISIYGATAATYERMTGIPGSFTHFLHGLACLHERAFAVTVRMPVTTINYEDIDACQNLIEAHGFMFQYSLDIHPRTDGDRAPLAYRLAPDLKAALDARKLGKPRAVQAPEPCASNEPFISCACGKSSFAVTPYGKMNLCVAFPTPQYDLRTGTIREGWEILKRTVDDARPTARYECAACDVQGFCRQGRGDAWLETGDMSACLPHFKEWATLEHHTHALLDPRPAR
ncbi:MAG: RadicalSAM domain-containing protein [Nitrospira sp.]|nr:MAG: RadicalSAM domain-containing protein [Nitrospira sp.]